MSTRRGGRVPDERPCRSRIRIRRRRARTSGRPRCGSMTGRSRSAGPILCDFGHQRPMPLVNTSKATAGGALTWMLLRTGAGRIWGCGSSSFSFFADFAASTSAAALNAVERRFPELVQPGAHGSKPLRIDVINPPRALAAIGHQAGFLQHLQMLGYGGSRDRHVVGDLADGSRPVAQSLEHRPAGRVGKCRKDSICVSHRLTVSVDLPNKCKSRLAILQSVDLQPHGEQLGEQLGGRVQLEARMARCRSARGGIRRSRCRRARSECASSLQMPRSPSSAFSLVRWRRAAERCSRGCISRRSRGKSGTADASASATRAGKSSLSVALAPAGRGPRCGCWSAFGALRPAE